jgi:CHAT domain-containing protein
MTRAIVAFIALALASVGLSTASPAAAAPTFQDFAIGLNAERQSCRAQWRFVGANNPTAIDLYCGAWERPSGELQRTAAANDAGFTDFQASCVGDPKVVSATSELEITQVACRRGAEIGVLRYGLIVKARGQMVYGLVFPSDWEPAVRIARVMLGLDRQVSAKNDAPGLSSIEAVYPPGPQGACSEAKYHGPPGFCSQVNYQLLRRRAFEYNSLWSFSAAERDFSDLLALHEKIAADDVAGEAEILAEIGVNLSASRRADEAAQFFAKAEQAAQKIHATGLFNKIENYRAMAALDSNDWEQALSLARAANAGRSGAKLDTAPGGTLSNADAERLGWEAAPSGSQRFLLTNDGETEADRENILSAQADFIQAVALRRLGRPGSTEALASAQARLGKTEIAPSWLIGLINDEEAQIALAQGHAAEAASLATKGLTEISSAVQSSREQAHLLLTLADALSAQGQDDAALLEGSRAIDIFAQQSEAPGFPASVGGHQLERLRVRWMRDKDPKVAETYFRTLSLVWDGAAARSAAQLAARLADHEGGGAARAYQDAERGYRAAEARRERLVSDPSSSPEARVAAEKMQAQSLKAYVDAQDKLRLASPRYLELLRPQTSGADMTAKLGPDEGYIRLALADNQGFGALITHDGIQPFRVDLTKQQVGALVERIRGSVRVRRKRLPDYDVEAAVALYQGLFSPVQTQLANVKILHLDAGEVLASVPFGALIASAPDAATLDKIKREQDYRGVDWMARHYAMDFTLGPAAFLRVRGDGKPKAAAGPVLAFGNFQPDPKGVAARLVKTRDLWALAPALQDHCRAEIQDALVGLPALPETQAEAVSDATIFGGSGRAVTGAAFTDTAFLSDPQLGGAGVLVLATHGVLGLSDCIGEPALLTSLGPDGQGLLTASRLLDVRLTARLVILSACDTAGGGKTDAAVTGLTDGGEALSGLARSFLYAGSTAVLATQWKAEATASAVQTKSILTDLKNGVQMAPALAHAQAAVFDKPDTSHPFFWASFVLLGDGASTL